MKVLVCPDKFKGTLEASKAAGAIARGWLAERPDDEVRCIPISDGGDGFGVLLGRILGAKNRRVTTVDAAHRKCVSEWRWRSESSLAIIESASTVGLAMLPRARYHPFELDTFGLGRVLRAAEKAAPRRCIIGIGGSATNDGGFGMARSLGWQFLDERGNQIRGWRGLDGLKLLKPPSEVLRLGELTVAVDVTNPLLGPLGCSRIYGPQKGLRPEDFGPAEKALRQLAKVTRKHLGNDFSITPGAGAAGGLGFGLMAFAGARVQNGIEIFSSLSGLDKAMDWADIVITGEGRIDRSTLMGKGAGYVLERCKQKLKACIGLAGMVDEEQSSAFFLCLALARLGGLEEARTRPAVWLARAARRAAMELQGGLKQQVGRKRGTCGRQPRGQRSTS